ncbi:MAG: thioredoxin family protein [Pseudomonadota bacterium]
MSDAVLTQIEWNEGNPDAAFAKAAAQALPLLLYWGAAWCPPCNRIRASVFERADFQALAPAFVALHVDGDSAGAQQLAERFHVRSYPTLIVFRPDGTEITRLPCELDGARFVQIFKLALDARRTVAESLSAALSRERPLADDEWRLLSFYSWDTDERQVLKSLDLAAMLSSMTRACTESDALLRLEWHTLHAAAMSGKGGIDQRAAVKRLEETLADPQAVRAQMDIVTNQAAELVRFLTVPQSPARMRLTQAWANALERLEVDPGLNLADQLAALRTRVRMSRLGQPDPDLEAVLRERVALASAAVSGPAMRHQVMNTAAGVLSDAGLLDEAEQLLLDELERSHVPFFFMHNLAAIAKKRGDPATAVRWYERAWDSATGPATRLQWGATYLQGLIDFAPHEAPRIDRFAGQLLQEIGGMGDMFCQRNRTQLERIASKLAVWNGASALASALRQATRAAARN